MAIKKEDKELVSKVFWLTALGGISTGLMFAFLFYADYGPYIPKQCPRCGKDNPRWKT